MCDVIFGSEGAVVVPRSVSLALWLPRVCAAPARMGDALRGVVGDDEPHQVRGLVSGSLAQVLTGWAHRVAACVAVCPVPGDVSSVPASVAPHATEAGEAVLVRLAGPSPANVALIPQVEQFGSAIEPGWSVVWDAVDVPEGWELQVMGACGSIADADRQLRAGMHEVTEALLTLDVARSAPWFADVVDTLRDPVDLSLVVPPDMSARVVSVLERAARLRTVVDVATRDEGGAVSASAAASRRAVLRTLDERARRAMEAATLLSPLAMG